ncbi:hypothetical protein ACSEQ0_26215 [Pseudomonas aeruginosa]
MIETLLGRELGTAETTFISKRNAAGQFELVATVGEAGCLLPSRAQTAATCSG